MSILLRRREMFGSDQSEWTSPILFDNGLNGNFWAVGKNSNSYNSCVIGDVIQTTTINTGHYINLYFIKAIDLSSFSTLNITYADNSSNRAVNLWMVLATGTESIIGSPAASTAHRWWKPFNNETYTAGKTYSWKFKEVADESSTVPYSDGQKYYIVIAPSSYSTSYYSRISRVWLE